MISMKRLRSFGICCLAVLYLLTHVVRAESEVETDSAASDKTVPNFRLLDYRGRNYELYRSGARVVVLYFTGIGCPIARQSVPKLQRVNNEYGPRGVAVWMVNSVPQNDYNDPTIRVIAQMGLNDKLSAFVPKDEEGKEAITRLKSMAKLRGVQSDAQLIGDPETFKLQVLEGTLGPLTLLRDENQLVAHHFGVTRLSEVVAIDTLTKSVIYRGSVDDQMVAGAQKPAPTKNYLTTALDEVLGNKVVSVKRTAAEGCLIQFSDELKKGKPVYSKQIAPVIKAKCANCHSAGNIGPFVLSGYDDVKQWSAMIQEVVLDKRMPPWDADPHYGKFVNDTSLTATEAKNLSRWIELGCPKDDGEDPLAITPEPAPKWKLGTPDYVVQIPSREEIPATGVLDYRYLDSEFAMPEDSWLRAAVVRPENAKVVHHIIVRLIYPEGFQGEKAESYFFTTWAPGVPQSQCPPDTGFFVPKGARFQFEIHYTTNGSVQTDQSEMGLYLASEKPRMRLDTRIAENRDLIIPPGVADAEHTAFHCFKRDAIVYNVGPHMHLRGKWFKFQLLYPDGRKETLLNIPRYDFNWQIGHVFATPIQVPAGSWLVCTGGFDNSENNPSNPDPKRRVRFGLQTSDEMFMGFMSVADLPDSKKDRSADEAIKTSDASR